VGSAREKAVWVEVEVEVAAVAEVDWVSAADACGMDGRVRRVFASCADNTRGELPVAVAAEAGRAFAGCDRGWWMKSPTVYDDRVV
jgi:hypothetical protein